MKTEAEILEREKDATELVSDFNLEEDREFFVDPANRFEFIGSLSVQEFEDLLDHINARVRGFDPRIRANSQDKGSHLFMAYTAPEKDKRTALNLGFKTIKDYIENSEDSPEEKAISVALAIEALIIWVHPFDDGNGRTSRFLGEFMQNGTVDIDQLIAATSYKLNRPHYYSMRYRVDRQTRYYGIEGPKGLFSGLEEADIEAWEAAKIKEFGLEEANKLRSEEDVEKLIQTGIILSLRLLLKNKDIQNRIINEARDNIEDVRRLEELEKLKVKQDA